MMRVKRSSRRGSAMVELSLIFVLFSTLLIGIMDFGQSLFYQQGVVERVRVAARYGAIHDPTDTTAIKNVLLYNQSQTPTDGRSTFFKLNASMVTVSTAGSGTDNYRLTVTLSGYSFPMLSSLLASSYAGPTITVSQPLGQYF
jgi:Flp pilus assembly protein TadG